MSLFRTLLMFGDGVDVPESRIVRYNSYSKLNVTNNTFDNTIIKHTYDEDTKVGEIICLSDIKTVSQEAFNKNYDLTYIHFPNTLESIAYGAFKYCSLLETVDLPDTVKEIDSHAFAYCYNLKNITLPKSLEHLGTYAFAECYIEEIIIPNNITTIPDYCFSRCKNLKSLTLHENVIEINYNALFYCESLTNINIPKNIKSIDLTGCSSLEEIDLPYGITTVYLNGCSSLKNIIIPNSVTSINFDGCSSLIEINIPSSVTKLPSYSFRDCNKLNKLTIPPTLTNIGGNVFENTNNIKELHISNLENWLNITFTQMSNTDINHSTPFGEDTILYLNNEPITTIVIPETITKLKPYSFLNYKKLINVTLHNNITDMDVAFINCENLNSIDIPSSVKYINPKSFYGCENLSYITVDENNETYDSRDNCNCIIEKENNALTCVCLNSQIPDSVNEFYSTALTNRTINDLYIPQNVVSLSQFYFYNCVVKNNITISSQNTKYKIINNCIIRKDTNSLFRGFSISTIPNNITELGPLSFSECRGLEEIIIPNNITTIGNSAFWDCKDLRNVTINANISKISDNVFAFCNLDRVNIPDSVTSLGYDPFRDTTIKNIHIGSGLSDVTQLCSAKIDYITVSENNPTFDSRNNCNAVVHTADNYIALGSVNTAFDESIWRIGPRAFEGSLIENAIIPNNITNINDSAFRNSKLKTVELSAQNIGLYAFSHCYDLESVTIKNGKDIFGYAFQMCSSLKEIKYLANVHISIRKEDEFYEAEKRGTFYYTKANKDIALGLYNSSHGGVKKYGWIAKEIEVE